MILSIKETIVWALLYFIGTCQQTLSKYGAIKREESIINCIAYGKSDKRRIISVSIDFLINK